MPTTVEFISKYAATDHGRIAFAWNGKHAAEFQDSNQQFRWEVVTLCIARPEHASLILLEHLFLADAEWAGQAWGSPHHFAQLGKTLLECGQEHALDSFSKGFVRSFDTFGACHEIRLPETLLVRLIACAQESLSNASEENSRNRLKAALELFGKIKNATSTQGWAKVEPGAPVSDIRVVWPRWHHRLWAKLSRLWTPHET